MMRYDWLEPKENGKFECKRHFNDLEKVMLYFNVIPHEDDANILIVEHDESLIYSESIPCGFIRAIKRSSDTELRLI